ncbi:glycosyltransferase family 2 protein [Sporofaciens musculi]|uniref:glycosyltransferase family 2 protein n=1 Tax=Sporofaciens musculi TaxID=2681861 RepID=UPI00258A662C|nr:glycosyltransferase family 2 protein [Sporofaciens musculi]
MEKQPFISALIVTRNEKEYIEKSLVSLITQTYPKDRYEILIIDGMSDDGTREIVQRIRAQYQDNMQIQMLDNPKYLLASGWNIGIKRSQGDYVVRIDAHAEVSSEFLQKSMDTILAFNDAVCVGGKLITKSNDNDIVSLVLSSPFGVGNSSFRVSDTAGYTDTAVYGLYKKEIFDKVGYFNESYERNQDIELHSRIRKYGGKFYFNPEIISTYYARNSVKKMLKQANGNGKWNMVLLKNRESALSIRHLIPFIFVIFLLISSIGGLKKKNIWQVELGVIILHLFCGLSAAIKKTKRLKDIIRMPFLFIALHTAYGIGYLGGILKKINTED